jgi:two-component system CheB/CheR fusion protein
MPADSDPGMAFVLVQHLAPDHKSILTELIRRYTRMEVFEVEDGMVVKPNCAYIIPPNCDMAFLDGTLQLLEPMAPRGQRMPIDFFFRSLAQDQHEHAIGVILSGTGSDGTLGLRRIKGEGGMAMAQTPESTDYDGMPRSAIGTGLVDYEMPPAEMPAQLIAYVAHAFGKPPVATNVPSPKSESTMKKILIILRAQTSHDFSQYKPSTIHRRVDRRMAVNQLNNLDEYLKFIQRTPTEVDALFRDLLIGVTNFFRDGEAFYGLEEQVIPKLFANKRPGGRVRVWVPGCSTGEEAYSIAILLQEHVEAMKQSYQVQVFATDIDGAAITKARTGLFPASIAVDLTSERLGRFFTAEPGGGTFRINKGIRDLIVFSEQDLIKDPPFSKLDLISCRNLLIYLGSELQKKLLPLFHYSLNPGGMLFLGSSESTGDFAELFAVLDRKLKLYLRKENFHGMSLATWKAFPTKVSAIGTALPRTTEKPRFPLKTSGREITEQAILRHGTPPTALVNGAGDIIYFYGRTGMYLEPAPGEGGVTNILKMAREGLRQELTIALRTAIETKETVRKHGLSVKTNGHYTSVNLAVLPIPTSTAGAVDLPLYLVMLDEAVIADPASIPQVGQPGAAVQGVQGPPEGDEAIQALRQELRANEEFLKSTNEELETSNEELKSSNEEMQSVNEELQSTNEELETSKEELQSLNEELATVNSELQTKVTDLSRANNDMNNLLAGTGIATIFVDHQMRLVRFTPAATKMINLIQSDIGRPVGHIVLNLVGYTTLVADIQAVLDHLVPLDMQVETAEGHWYRLRIQPYRTLDNVIEGAVITFVDITEVKAAQDALGKANELKTLASIARDSIDAFIVQDLSGKILAWNPGAERVYGWTRSEALAMNVRDRFPKELRQEALDRIHDLSLADHLETYSLQVLAKDGSLVNISLTATALVDDDGQRYAIASTERKRGKGKV